ncbi:MAG: hypothetical protein KAH14_08405 [Clostridiales bacterium]|nr:hypothetical protein [Clostridiales bacterium]
MNILQKQQIFTDMNNGIRPCCLPMDVVGFIEYRKDIYNQGEPDKSVKAGEITLSADGSKKYTKDGGIWDVASKHKYHNTDDVINVALNKFIIEDITDEMLSIMKDLYDRKSKTHVPIPWHYGTLLTRCQIEFGWEPLLEASALEPEALKLIIDRVAKSTLRVLEGWSRLNEVNLIIVHDDIASTQGLIWSPQFLKKYIFSWYKKFFDIIHKNGKKVLYITDGNYLKIIDDLLALEPDGLYIESSSVNPSAIMKKGGKELFYLLKTDSRIMDFGNEDDIKAEVIRIQELHKAYPKIFSYIGGGTVKPENKELFQKYYNEYLVYN